MGAAEALVPGPTGWNKIGEFAGGIGKHDAPWGSAGKSAYTARVPQSFDFSGFSDYLKTTSGKAYGFSNSIGLADTAQNIGWSPDELQAQIDAFLQFQQNSSTATAQGVSYRRQAAISPGRAQSLLVPGGNIGAGGGVEATGPSILSPAGILGRQRTVI